eukprot:symbB.v1.2.013535.t1/scaffold961.1/size148688/7
MWALSSQMSFVNPASQNREVSVSVEASKGYFPVGNAKQTAPYGERDPLPEGYGIRTGLSDLLKPLNAEAGVVAKEDSIPTVLVMLTGIVLLFLFYLLLLLIDNQSVLLPPEDEFDEYVANFLPYFFFGEKIIREVAPSLYVGKIGTQSNSVFVVNGFVPHWRAAFSSTGEACWFVVEFNPSEVSWKRFEEILGATDPSKASSDSIRGLLYQHYKDCGLTQQPTTMDNGVHFSAGALEGMRERMLWTNITPEEDPLGRLLLSSGVPRKFLDEWMDNPDVDGWYIGTKQMSGPLFACTEACDTVTFKESAIRFLQEKGESLHCSTLRARLATMNQLPRRVLGAYFVAEGTGFAHHCYVQRRAKKAPRPELAPVDEEYRRQFMSLARCQGEGSDPLACSRFVRHAFFGAPPEALPREAVHEWLQSHLGAASDDALAALEATLGQFASHRTWGGSSCFVYGQGTVEAWYKPLLFRSFMEAQRFLARRRLKQQGFQETRDPNIPNLSYWERCDSDVDEPPLLVLHGYGRGLLDQTGPCISTL